MSRKSKITIYDKQRFLSLLRFQDANKIPPILEPLKNPCRKKMITGGRGSGKSETVVSLNIREASLRKMRILWTREILKSIKRSIYDLIVNKIPVLGFPGWEIREEKIFNKITKSLFVFEGLKDIRAAQNIKSYANFDRAIVEEAQAVSEENWRMLVPTIRATGSEIWAIFNRYDEFDPVYQLYCMNPDKRTMVIECNWRDNPWFPLELKYEMERDKADDYDLYLHIWENHPIAQLEKAVMDRTLVDLAMKRDCSPDGPQIIGVDVARFGGDKTKAYERRGMKCVKLFERKHEKPIVTAREIAGKADNKYTQIIIDNGGLGAGGMIDWLTEKGFENVVSVNFGGNPKDKKNMPMLQLKCILKLRKSY